MLDPLTLLRPRRRIEGISAVLLPFTLHGEVDWPAFDAHLERTAAVGLIPAVNMDTGYVNLLEETLQDRVLDHTREVLGGSRFVAGAFVADHPGNSFDRNGYCRRIEAIQSRGGLPILFQSYGLTQPPGSAIVERYAELAHNCDRFLAFELTPQLAPFGALYDLETFAGLLEIPQCVGAKHSSFHREPEWERLQLRNARRPEFRLYTGNDFAIDMVMYGSDYLLGLSTFAPDLFARRDTYWETGDPRFYELNDQLQYLGAFAFREPAPAYKHSAAQFLKLRGWITCDAPHPRGLRRPDTDIPILREIGQRLGVLS